MNTKKGKDKRWWWWWVGQFSSRAVMEVCLLRSLNLEESIKIGLFSSKCRCSSYCREHESVILGDLSLGGGSGEWFGKNVT